MGEKYRATVITVSDRASAGVYEDRTGPAVAAFLAERGYEVTGTYVVPDERADIEAALREAAEKDVALALTCGGTGFSPLARLIVLVGFCMPLPASVTALAAENGVDPSLPAFVTNLTFIVSFGVLWTMIALAGVPTEGVLSSSSSAFSSSSALELSSSA